MSLRWRLSILFALLAGFSTALTAFTSFSSTQSRLYSEVDSFLAERVGATTRQAPPILGGDRRIDPRGRGPGFGPGRDSHELLQSDLEAQYLDRLGAVDQIVGTLTLPVNALELSIAAGTSRSSYRTVDVEGSSFRMLTVSLPGGGALQVARNVEETQRILAALRWRFVVVGIIVMAGGVVVGLLVARHTVKPLEQLTLAAEHVADTNHLSVGVAATARTDESGRLARAFASMLDALGRSREQQRRLVQDASHELRTPLTSLRTNVEVLSRHPNLEPAERSLILADVETELTELTTLVAELVTLAADRYEDETPEDVDLDELVRRVTTRASRRHQRDYQVFGHGSIVKARPAGIERAVNNLVDNAAKFSPDGTTIDVELLSGRVSVADRGPGIAPADMDRVFDRFYRADASRTLPGSGLGLSIVRQIVEADGGTVFAGNHSGGGALVGFELPVP